MVLLDNGADVMARWPGDGGTALHAAARADQTTALQVLLGRGAKIDARNRAGKSPLHTAAREGCMDAVRVLCGRGANLNATDNAGWTPAHRAA
jgi:ankyrin repeat protein